MRVTFLKFSAGMLFTAAITSSAFAEGYYSSSPEAPPSTTAAGYSSDASSSSTVIYNTNAQAPAPAPQHQHKKHDRFSVSLNIPGTNTVLTYKEPKHGGNHHRQQPYWVPMTSDDDVPANAVVGGGQRSPNTAFYVCRAYYQNGTHPGKLFKGNCNISWGGREIVMDSYEVLVSDTPVSWIHGNYGSIPRNAIAGGGENNHPLYICQADYVNGTHTGKIIGNNCNFGWGGKEITMPYYNVLVG